MKYVAGELLQKPKTFLENTIIYIAVMALALSGVFGLLTAQAGALEAGGPRVTGENFNTHQGDDYTGVNVGFNVENFEYFEEVSVELYDEDKNLIVKNVGDAPLLYDLVNDGSGTFSTPFVLNDPTYDDDYWTFGDWKSYSMPVKAVITVNGIPDTITYLNEPNGWSFSALVDELIEQETTRPTVEEVKPSDSSIINRVTRFTVKATHSTGIEKIALYLRNQDDSNDEFALKEGDGDEWFYDVDTRKLAGDGQYDVALRVVSNGGQNRVKHYNNRGGEHIVTVDNTAPEVTLISPEDGSTVRGDINVAFEITDDPSGVDKAYFNIIDSNGKLAEVDGKKTFWLEDQGDDVWALHIDTKQLEDGEYTLKVRPSDNLGNPRHYNNFSTFVVDNDQPTVNFTGVTPTEGSFLNDDFEVEFTAIDNHKLDMVNVSLYEGDSSSGKWVTTCYKANSLDTDEITKKCIVNLPDDLEDGEYTIHINARDEAGNWGWGSDRTRTVIIDRSDPVFDILPNEQTLVVGEGAMLTIDNKTFKPGVSGVQSMTWMIDGEVLSTDESVSFSSLVAGVYTVSLEVIDNAGNTSTKTATVTYTNPTSPSTDNEEPDAYNPALEDEEEFAGDPEGEPVDGGLEFIAALEASAAANEVAADTDENTDDENEEGAQEVEGGSTDDGEGEVAGVTDENTAGFGWTLWLLVVAALAALYFIFAKRRAEQE